mmetsp:Transcript_657/g.547  ORF Transcript_657/g.547 Transcript_657/m.547 type:complete len:122 (-) Transcript_657:555-920(-)
MNAAVVDATRIRKLAPNLGASVQMAFDSAADVTLTADNSIEMLQVESPVSSEDAQSFLGTFTYVGILPSAFQACASNVAMNAFESENRNTQVTVKSDTTLSAATFTGLCQFNTALSMFPSR